MLNDSCINIGPTRPSAQMCSNVEQRKDDAGSKQAACGYSQTKQYKQWQKP